MHAFLCLRWENGCKRCQGEKSFDREREQLKFVSLIALLRIAVLAEVENFTETKGVPRHRCLWLPWVCGVRLQRFFLTMIRRFAT